MLKTWVYRKVCLDVLLHNSVGLCNLSSLQRRNTHLIGLKFIIDMKRPSLVHVKEGTTEFSFFQKEVGKNKLA